MKYLQRILILIGIAALFAAPVGQGNYMVYLLCSWLIFSISAMGLNLTLGYAGQISLAQAAFMGIGAYTSALLTMAGLHWIVATPIAMGLCFVVGLLLGYPALRVQHHFLAFVTLAFGTIVFLVIRNEAWLTGGALGLSGIKRPSFLGFDTMKQLHFYYFTLVVFLLVALAFWWLVRSPWGRAFKALRENPVRANSLGVDTRRMTLLAFAIGSALGGLAGALMASLVQFLDPAAFSLVHSLKILLMVVVGGVGSFFGPIIGAALVILLPEVLRFTEGYYLMIYSGFVMLMMIFWPKGLMGIFHWVVGQFKGVKMRADAQQGSQL